MIWSWSTSRMFHKCQRQWYFKTQVANHKSTDTNRREAFLLSSLQSLYAWRGNLVDEIIGSQVIPLLRNHRPFHLAQTIQQARNLFDKQWSAAISHVLRTPGFVKSQAGNEFAAFHSIEYGLEVTSQERDTAWNEVEKSLINLSRMTDLLKSLQAARYLVEQRPLIYSYPDFSVRAVPDLIAFFDDSPPLIVDWKVNIFGINDYRQQLGTYALALHRCDPHKDFPSISRFNIADTKLLEVQLLTNIQRSYTLEEEDIIEIDAYIFNSAQQMLLALGDSEDNSPHPFEYPVTNDASLCGRCNFRSLCWKEKQSWEKWKQTSLI